MFSSSSSHDQTMYSYNLSQPMQRWKPNVEIAPNCPRCDSSNTKFCYYNNYSLTQPRYFCKGCRRYWTKGGSLRNVPVGGGCRKNRRAKSVRISSGNSSSSSRLRASASDSLRPDLALDDMASSLGDYGSNNIDLAMLYSKFLNQHSGTDQGLVADQSLDLLGSDQVGLMGDQFDYCLDPNEYDQLALPAVEADHVFENNSLLHDLAWQAPEQLQQQGFCPVSEVGGMSHRHHHHHQDLMGGDWCPSIDQSSFGAF